MKIDIAKLSDGRGLDFEETWDAGARDLDVPGRAFKSGLNVRVSAQQDYGMVKVSVEARGLACLTCARCFKSFDQEARFEFTLSYPADLSERVFSPDEDIREEIILSSPQKILCREDCRGLCPRCGADLNTEKCTCNA